tara:strand:+ start:116 stop:772 length:657 start_codon:yes stop_codon:yes gene_type:complete
LKFRNRSLQISCDGGAATGKSTGGKMIAKKYKLKFLSSGLLYRYASYLVLKYKPRDKFNFIKKKFKKLDYKKLKKLNLHSPKISKYSAVLAKIKKIRIILKRFQIDFSRRYRNCCIEGRDISSNILPKSDLKFFFKCNINIAAKRRFKELKKKNRKIKLIAVKKALRIRNKSDIKRKNSPLLRHRDSIEIDTGKLDKLAMLKIMSLHIEKVLKEKNGN